MTFPIIGVTSYRNQSQLGFDQYSISEHYISSLAQAGACPIIIPLGLGEVAMDDLLSRLDGVLFSGGGDIHPRFYSSPGHSQVAEVDEDRDRVELYLLKQILRMQRPILGVCRGLQLINVGLGGSLWDDLGAQNPEFLDHDCSSDWPRDHLAHEIVIHPDSRLAEILGAKQAQVNSLHHQGIRSLSEQLRPLASAPDGLIEAVEIRGYPYGIGVQWHPEWMPQDPQMQALFRSFVSAAKRTRRGPPEG